jgi:type I restriction enzyme S subunit
MTTMAIDNKDKKVLNVPHLRFPEFSGEWENTELQYIAPNICSGKDKPTSNGTVALYGSTGIIGMTRLASYNEEIVLVARVGANAGQLQITTIPCGVTDNTLIINAKEWNRYIYYYLQHYNLNRLVFGSGQPLITGSMLKKLKIIYGEESERNKIVNLLCLLDERIATQNKIIEKLQSLIKGIAQHCIKESTSGNTYVKLGDICQITTGKLDANAQVDNGIYPFFTCAEQPFKIDSFAFDTEALLISGNGANLGYINYYKGKFNAYQRTYVLDLFSENIQYIKWALKVLLPKRIAIEKSSSNTPYIVLSTLTDLRLPIPCKSKQSFIANLMQSLERKLSNQIAQYDSYNYLKQYLLRQMFI